MSKNLTEPALKRQKLDPESLESLPVELRNLVYSFGFDEQFPVTGEPLRCLEVDSTNNTTLEAKVEGLTVFEMVPRNGKSEIFNTPLAEFGVPFLEYLSENAPKIVFSFATPNALQLFAERLDIHLRADQSFFTNVQVAFRLFDQDTKYAAMSDWKKLDMAHGYKQGAQAHVKKWMDAAEKLPGDARVHVTLVRPWMEYRALRNLTAPLRRTNRHVKVDAVKANWAKFVKPDLHLSLAVASITGEELPWSANVSQLEADELIAYGSRGFRGQTG